MSTTVTRTKKSPVSGEMKSNKLDTWKYILSGFFSGSARKFQSLLLVVSLSYSDMAESNVGTNSLKQPRVCNYKQVLFNEGQGVTN